MVVEPFAFARIPRIYFGPGEFNRLGALISGTASRILLVTGSKSFRSSPRWKKLQNMLERASIRAFDAVLSGEPSPEDIDSVVRGHAQDQIEAVVAIGGGSVLDGGKAISAMLPHRASVVDYLEGVGTRTHSGVKVPFIAVPTTAGTGSETTKNAVLRRVGPNGFKASLRHDNMVPDIAIVDPELSLSCPPDLTAACGMDALTQLLESYVSPQATPMTDALAYSGLECTRDALVSAATEGEKDIAARAGMAYAAMISGITLANAGLGVVHGLASSIGGFLDIPHGVFCGTMIGVATEMNITKLERLKASGSAGLPKYAQIGHLLAGRRGQDVAQGCRLLVEKLMAWTDELSLPRLGHFGLEESHLDGVVKGAGNKNNPVQLEKSEMKAILEKRL